MNGKHLSIGGKLKNFDVNEYLPAKESRRIDPFIQYGIIAANQAITNSGILESNLDLTKVGVNFGAGIGGIDTIEKNKTLLENCISLIKTLNVKKILINS